MLIFVCFSHLSATFHLSATTLNRLCFRLFLSIGGRVADKIVKFFTCI